MALALGITPETLSRYESVDTPGTWASALASALCFPETYFFREPAPQLGLEGVSFRAGTRVPNRSRRAALASGSHGIGVADWISRHFNLPAVDIPRTEDAGPEEAARLLCEMWGSGTAPLCVINSLQAG